MYQKKQVIRQSSDTSDKTYHRQLFGRVFTLHRMIQRRVEKVNQLKEKVYGYEKEIRSLERKIEGIKKDVSSIRKENRVIQSEVKSYRMVIEKLKDNEELKYKPNFDVRITTKGGYEYLEGRIRLPMVNGRRGKEITHSYGRWDKFLDKHQGQKLNDVFNYYENDLEERWWDGIKLLEG